MVQNHLNCTEVHAHKLTVETCTYAYVQEYCYNVNCTVGNGLRKHSKSANKSNSNVQDASSDIDTVQRSVCTFIGLDST